MIFNLNKEPDGINDNSVRFWKIDSIDNYAKSKDVDVKCVLAEETSGEKTYLLYQGGVPIFSNQSIESIGTYIDMMFLDRELK